jgi:hypothetical protein
MSAWMYRNKVASAFVLGMIVIAAYASYLLLDHADEQDRQLADEVKHARRAGRARDAAADDAA